MFDGKHNNVVLNTAFFEQERQLNIRWKSITQQCWHGLIEIKSWSLRLINIFSRERKQIYTNPVFSNTKEALCFCKCKSSFSFHTVNHILARPSQYIQNIIYSSITFLRYPVPDLPCFVFYKDLSIKYKRNQLKHWSIVPVISSLSKATTF